MEKMLYPHDKELVFYQLEETLINVKVNNWIKKVFLNDLEHCVKSNITIVLCK